MDQQQGNQELGWEDEISNDGQSGDSLLPPGEYPYEIVNLRRVRYQPKEGGNLPECWNAKLTVRLCMPDGHSEDVDHSLFMVKKCEWTLCEFFLSIGQRKHGEALKPRWDSVIGSRGLCRLAHKVVKTKTYNDIKFLPPPAGSVGGGATQQQPAPSGQSQWPPPAAVIPF